MRWEQAAFQPFTTFTHSGCVGHRYGTDLATPTSVTLLHRDCVCNTSELAFSVCYSSVRHRRNHTHVCYIIAILVSLHSFFWMFICAQLGHRPEAAGARDERGEKTAKADGRKLWRGVLWRQRCVERPLVEGCAVEQRWGLENRKCVRISKHTEFVGF